ncbi:Transcriptional regulator, LacI family [Nostocoides japonicum T1-X7]|uniref:Transcriptional regulator, LacI family n=1 Tax=Nostocoides japonicum T1-X7 TaxID=1194083 RepID=A0A077LYP5_9MICO|nr:LacI family DNA-binding transcriptional regulator [Tetrasphaera japonica]CCH78027.1 Transcriptional regulator, LacI family [Tetrasphaera japonica T1-X7]
MGRTKDERRAPGMHDVARRAGVSHQTVSRVVNEMPNVRPATRARVLQAIADLGYRPNSAARALVTRRSGTIGVVTSGSMLWGPSSALLGVERAAREAGYFVSLASLGSDPAQVGSTLAHFHEQAVEGVIVIAPEASLQHVADPLLTEVPVVMIGAPPAPDSAVRTTSVDQEMGGRRATRYLIGLGHKQIHHVSGPLEWFDASLRVAGWRAELAAAGLPDGTLLVGDWTARSGYAAGVRIRELIHGRSPQAPTAVFAANDLMALGVIHALAEAGLSVPRDVSVVGFDDIPGADYFTPGLTTVRQDFEELGRRCIEILLEALRGEPSIVAPIAPQLIERASAASPRD